MVKRPHHTKTPERTEGVLRSYRLNPEDPEITVYQIMSFLKENNIDSNDVTIRYKYHGIELWYTPIIRKDLMTEMGYGPGPIRL